MHVHMSDIDFDRCEKYLELLAAQGLSDITLQSLTYRALWAKACLEARAER